MHHQAQPGVFKRYFTEEVPRGGLVTIPWDSQFIPVRVISLQDANKNLTSASAKWEGPHTGGIPREAPFPLNSCLGVW